ncbi:hypothetical protein [Prochlorothrix hollandica]|uniref:hypothetical protein n=1 Tax=Prochlorothrix hollandica TaxID=1223 RepID=UPI00034B683E|nr:hypothetical protein [Prochlorothrix hollandica]
MTLEPCNVCGALNSSEEEICLSCGYPTRGNKRPAVFVWAAIVLAVLFALPPLVGVAQWIFYRLQPPDSSPPQQESFNSGESVRYPLPLNPSAAAATPVTGF